MPEAELNNLKVSETKTEDVPAIFKLWTNLIDMHNKLHPVFSVNSGSSDLIKTDISRMIEGADSAILKIENGSELIGFTFVKILRKPKAFTYNECGYIGETIIDENYRSKGAGKKLIEAAEKWFAEKGISCIELQAAVKNERGKKFWNAMGYQESTFHLIKFIDKK